MAARTEITKGVTGQAIYFYPQEGRPSATPTVQILDQYGSTISAAVDTYVTQEATNTTSNGATARGATSMVLDSVVGIEWRHSYLITNALEQREWVRVKSIDTPNLTVEFDEPLEFAHADEAAFVATGFHHTLQSTEVDELVELYRARAVYTVDSQEYYAEVAFDVVLIPLRSPLTVEFLKKRRPGVTQQEGSAGVGTDFADAREVAWDRVLKGIRNAGTEPYQWRPALLKTPDDVEEWAMAELDLQLWMEGVDVLNGNWDPQQAQEHLEQRVRVERESALATLEWMDKDDDDSRATDEIKPNQGPDLQR